MKRAWAAIGPLLLLASLPCRAQEIVEVVTPQATLRSGPHSDFDRYTPVTAGVRLQVVGRDGDWLHVLAPDAYIHQKDVKVLAAGVSGWPSRVFLVRRQADEVRVRLDHPCAWQIREEPEIHRLTVDFPGVPMKMHEMAFAPDEDLVREARLIPTPQGTRLELYLPQGLWGYQTRWEGQELVLTLQRRPRGLEGLRITLDAGHGGADSGAPGPGGSFEKQHNLRVTLALRDLLEERGAVVTLTRSGDSQVKPDQAPPDQELAARVQVAENSRAQLFLSIHHNSHAVPEKARSSHATHVYYYHPHSAQLARHLARPLAEAIGESSYQHLWRSFAVTRQSGMPAVLLECNFVSNPDIEREVLLQSDYAEKAARGILAGLENFLQDR